MKATDFIETILFKQFDSVKSNETLSDSSALTVPKLEVSKDPFTVALHSNDDWIYVAYIFSLLTVVLLLLGNALLFKLTVELNKNTAGLN